MTFTKFNPKPMISRMPHIKDRIVRKIYADKYDNFFMVVSKEYDQNLTILHSESELFSVRFKRNIEPDSLQVFDINMKFMDKESEDK